MTVQLFSSLKKTGMEEAERTIDRLAGQSHRAPKRNAPG